MSDVAVETADIILVRRHPLDVVAILQRSRATHRRMIQNLVCATGERHKQVRRREARRMLAHRPATVAVDEGEPAPGWRRLCRARNMTIGTILLILLILAVGGALPTGPHSKHWGYYPSGSHVISRMSGFCFVAYPSLQPTLPLSGARRRVRSEGWCAPSRGAL